MLVPFGVSVGDFISTLGLIRKIAAALAESHGSGAQFRKLEATLGCLERAVKRVEDVGGEDDEFAARFKETGDHLTSLVADFHKKIAKYQPSLKLGGSGRKWRDAFRKIQFTAIRDDIADFETQLLVQMGSLQLLLEEEKNRALSRIEHRIQCIETKFDETQSSQMMLATAASQIFGLLQGILGVLLASGSTFAISIPQQIAFHGHLTFQDAWGEYFPLHIEMVGCWEMLYAILQIKSKGKPGLDLVKARQFKLQDGSVSGKWSDVDVEKPYDQVFKSGGRWDMAIVFPRDQKTEDGCPRCGRPEGRGVDASKIECKCRLCYSKASEVLGDVSILPTHFVMPSTVVTVKDPVDHNQPDSQAVADSPSDLSQHVADWSSADEIQDHGHADDAENEGEVPEPVAFTSTWHGVVRLDDVTNVYLGRPPPVFLRGLDGTWYIIPWRVFRSFEGLRFLAENILEVPQGRRLCLKDWNKSHEINNRNWRSEANGVYYGMVVELVCSSSDETIVSAGAIPGSGPSRSPTGLRCHLCSKTFFSQITLGRHTATHLRDSVCPGTCTICGVI